VISHKAGTKNTLYFVRFEVFTALTTKIAVFWDVTPCGSLHIVFCPPMPLSSDAI
jgi:hypothetical protein